MGKEDKGVREIEAQYIEEFKQLEDPESQCEYLLQLGMRLQQEEGLRQAAYRIEGCQAAVWCRVRQTEGRIYFAGDSDSLLVRGILYILKEMYDGRPAGEAGDCPPLFLTYISDAVIYKEIKVNGIAKCYQKLAAYK